MKLLKRKTQEQINQNISLEYDRYLVKKQAIEEKKSNRENTSEAFVSLKDIQKVYPNGVHSVIDFNLEINKGEFIVFVGPSGCGKTTTLRMICGLEEISAGSLYIDGVFSNELKPFERGVSMVFQNYALFPHLTVYENMAYGLKIRKVRAPKLDKEGNQVVGIDNFAINRLEKEKKWILKNQPDDNSDIEKIEHDILEYQTHEIPLFVYRKLNKEEIEARIQKAAKILNLSELLYRKPSQLSGGQCQRVALGRVIVSDAKLLLMDEPLSNLDAKLRVSMREEIIKLHKTLGATTVYVTHDQVEAMTMSNRIVVMNQGKIIQIGTPQEVYEHPNTIFVASFIGSPTMNILEASFKDDAILVGDEIVYSKKGLTNVISSFYKNELELAKKELDNISLHTDRRLIDVEIDKQNQKIAQIESIIETKQFPLSFGIRPEDIKLATTKSKDKFSVVISSFELLGEECDANVLLKDKTLKIKIPFASKIKENQSVEITINAEKSHLFDTLSGKAIY